MSNPIQQQSLANAWNVPSPYSQQNLVSHSSNSQGGGSLADAWSNPTGGLSSAWGQSSFSTTIVSTHGRDLITSAVKEGALSTREDREMLEKVKKIASETVDSVIAIRNRISTSIDKFENEANELNDNLSSYAKKLMTRLTKGEVVSTIEAGNLSFLCQTAKNVADRFFETSKQLIELQKLNTDGMLGDYRGAIDLVFYARTKELGLLKERLEVLQKHENHELKIMIALHDQQLKEETQRFDQFMVHSKFLSEERQKEFERGMVERKQKHQEEVDLLNLALEDKKVGFEHEKGMATIEIDRTKVVLGHESEMMKNESEREIELLKQKNHREVEKYRIEADKEARLQEIDAQARTETIKALATMATPAKCLIM